MIVWGSYDRQRHEDTGRFHCPQCEDSRDFTLVRTWKFFHIYFIPLGKQELLAECIQCDHCKSEFPITVLAGTGHQITSAFAAGDADVRSIAGNFGNVVTFTEAAIREIQERHVKGQFGEDVVVRVEPDRSEPRKVIVAFDFPLADGRDWIGESNGIPVVVNREVAPELQGRTIDYRDGDFVHA